MKLNLLSGICLLLLFVSCSLDVKQRYQTNSIVLRTHSEQLQSNFDSSLKLAKKLILTKLSEEEFHDFFSLNLRATGFNYDHAVLHTSDTLTQLPMSYQIFYDFVYDGDTLSIFSADFDSTLSIMNYREPSLIAFRKFIDKELRISKKAAIDLAVKNGMKRQGLDPIFVGKSETFYWECKNDCDGCLYLNIDANSGQIIAKGKVFYQY